MVFDANRFKAPPTSAGTPPELRSPRGDEDIRIHPQWRFDSLAMAKTLGKSFIIDQGLHADLSGRMSTCELRAAVNSNGEVFVWPIDEDDQGAKEAAEKATSMWIQVTWNIKDGHGHQPAEKQHGDPKWTFNSFEELLDEAAKGRILTDRNDAKVQAILAKKRKGR